MSSKSPIPLRRLPREVGGSVFGVDVAGYQAGRMDYPDDLYDAIRRRCHAPIGAVVEIGPGTGLATRDILAKLAPERLTAVEPDSSLAAHLRAEIIDPRFQVVQDGFLTATLDSGYDLACSAASFHWMEPQAALAKLRAILRPGATLALWWNVYRQVGVGDAFADAVTNLLQDVDLPPSEGENGHYSLDTDARQGEIAAAGFTDVTTLLFRRARTLTTAEVRQLYASYSYIRALDPSHRAQKLDAIASLADEQFGGLAPNVTLTALYLATAP